MKPKPKRLNHNLLRLKSFINTGFEVLLPRFCSYCDKKLTPEEEFLCPDCFYQVKTASTEFLKSEYERKFSTTQYIDAFYSPFLFEKEKPLQKLIHDVKYRYHYQTGFFLGKITAELITPQVENNLPDILVPVPLHPVKKAERGFNQALYIAKGISFVTGIPVAQDVLKRNVYSGSQTKLDISDRNVNISDVFSAGKCGDIKGKTIAVVDDIITTGATVKKCAAILKEKGAENVIAVSVAIAG